MRPARIDAHSGRDTTLTVLFLCILETSEWVTPDVSSPVIGCFALPGSRTFSLVLD